MILDRFKVPKADIVRVPESRASADRAGDF